MKFIGYEFLSVGLGFVEKKNILVGSCMIDYSYFTLSDNQGQEQSEREMLFQGLSPKIGDEQSHYSNSILSIPSSIVN